MRAGRSCTAARQRDGRRERRHERLSRRSRSASLLQSASSSGGRPGWPAGAPHRPFQHRCPADVAAQLGVGRARSFRGPRPSPGISRYEDVISAEFRAEAAISACEPVEPFAACSVLGACPQVAVGAGTAPRSVLRRNGSLSLEPTPPLSPGTARHDAGRLYSPTIAEFGGEDPGCLKSDTPSQRRSSLCHLPLTGPPGPRPSPRLSPVGTAEFEPPTARPQPQGWGVAQLNVPVFVAPGASACLSVLLNLFPVLFPERPFVPMSGASNSVKSGP